MEQNSGFSRESAFFIAERSSEYKRKWARGAGVASPLSPALCLTTNGARWVFLRFFDCVIYVTFGIIEVRIVYIVITVI